MKIEVKHLEILAEAQRFYSAYDFVNVDVSWSVPTPYIDATIPPDAIPLHDMVGSGEQSLLAKFDQNWEQHKEGKYQCITPCFRPGDRDKSEYHFGEFLKLELMMIPDGLPDFSELFAYILTPVIRFVEVFGVKRGQVRTVKTSKASWDLMGQKNGVWVELGSYGWRTATLPFGDRTWYYGTGIAEPRFSQVLT